MTMLDRGLNGGGLAPSWRSLSLGRLSLPAGVQKLLPGRRVVRDTTMFPEVLGRIGSLELRLARTVQDIRRAQRLRYQVFFSERAASTGAMNRLARRDTDAFDRHCDHLLVVDTAYRRHAGSRPRPRVVGTYRLQLQERAEQGIGFYSAREFEFSGFLAAHPGVRALELGRSCVLRPYRNRRTVELLWRGIWQYVERHGVGLLFGCASLERLPQPELERQLGFLHRSARAPDAWAISAHESCRVPMDSALMDSALLDSACAREVQSSLPPLIKAYLRIGGKFGPSAALDRAFGTTDVFVALRVADIDPRYIAYYSGNPSAS